MAGKTAGLLLYRGRGRQLEVLIGHPGGPWFARRDHGAWTVPKGGIESGEEPLDAAIREFCEETGLCCEGPYIDLGVVTLRSGKTIHIYAAEGEADPAKLDSATLTQEWPKGSGKLVTYPELDQLRWASPDEARVRLNPSQARVVGRLQAVLSEMQGRESR